MTLDELFDKTVFCPSGCWLWAGADSGNGRGGNYGKMRCDDGWEYVHRYSYKKFKGKIPKGFHVDHICRTWGWLPLAHRRCWNPDHLEAVKPIINQRRKYYGLG